MSTIKGLKSIYYNKDETFKTRGYRNWHHATETFEVHEESDCHKEGVSLTIENLAFCLTLYLTGVHFWGRLQHVGDVCKQNVKCQPLRTREIGGVRLSEALYVKIISISHPLLKQFVMPMNALVKHSFGNQPEIGKYF